MTRDNTLKDKVQTGVVESVDDPTFSGRIKVRVQGLHDNIAMESLPWCNYAGSTVYNQISIPKVGDHVRVKFAQDDVNSMEWYGFNTIDRELSWELANDYKDSHTLLYDYNEDLTIKYQTTSGLVLYYKGSYIQLQPDNTITIQMGPDQTSGVQIQLTDGKIYMSAPQQINIVSGNELNLSAKSITFDSLEGLKLAGDTANTCAVNGVELITLLQMLAQIIDMKLGYSTAGIASAVVDGAKEKLLNQKMSYIKGEAISSRNVAVGLTPETSNPDDNTSTDTPVTGATSL